MLSSLVKYLQKVNIIFIKVFSYERTAVTPPYSDSISYRQGWRKTNNMNENGRFYPTSINASIPKAKAIA